jgi:hypothetical protein
MTLALQVRSREFHITVLGRTLEHLGTQMYKRRDVALAELVANCWDAGATEVAIIVPQPANYDAATSAISITDNGCGMSEGEIDDEYLVIGRNRRAAGQPEPMGRKVMGRKGVGKLAGFGLARRMRVTTWRDGVLSALELDSSKLRAEGSQAATIPVPGEIRPVDGSLPYPSGTTVDMSDLKHKTPVDVDGLRAALSRRFSRTVRGQMIISVNGVAVDEPDLNLHLREPATGTKREEIGDGRSLSWWAGFSTTVLPRELQGFTVLVHGKTAQAPPYFFDVEARASGQHGTKYLTGVIEADYLDDGRDDETDRVSTDRQEIDWDDELARPLHAWGDKLTRRLLLARTKHREDAAEGKVDKDPALRTRIEALDRESARQVRRFIRSLGGAETDEERILPLADTLVRAFEYRHFHDFISQLDAAAAEPDQLGLVLEYMRTWKTLESRAILEIIKGRLDIVDKFHIMIAGDAAETAHRVGQENLHDLIADYPWLINPEWQVLAEEKQITRQLREWGDADLADPDDRSRYDFLALGSEGRLVVIEIKRSGHPVELKDLHQLEGYASKLSQSRTVSYMLFLSGDRYAILERELKAWNDRDDGDLTTWRAIHERTRAYYEHYRAVLESDTGSHHFGRKEKEIARTRQVLDRGAYRGLDRRASGLGPQDVDLD